MWKTEAIREPQGFVSASSPDFMVTGVLTANKNRQSGQLEIQQDGRNEQVGGSQLQKAA
ncbi:hypothetical protein W02_36560 [Nitrospira sp. KM1]|nr:hypothetical protein W02_36560 [Nitrospira sp. KM1]